MGLVEHCNGVPPQTRLDYTEHDVQNAAGDLAGDFAS